MKQFLVYLFVLLFLSCNNSQESEDVPILHVNPNETEEVNLSSFMTEVEYVKLDSGNEKYIGNIDKIIINGQKIFVLDSDLSVALFVYDNQGNLLFDISNYGRGPGEFMGPYDFDVDSKLNQIIIFDGASNKLIFYDGDNGSLIKEKIIPFTPRRFKKIEEGFIFYMNNILTSKNSYNIIITDNKLNIINQHIEINENLKNLHFSLPVNFTEYNGKTYFCSAINYSVYNYEELEFKKFLNVDFGNYKLSSDFYRENLSLRERINEIGNAAYNISNYYENDDFVFFLYSYMDNQNYYLSSKKSNKVIHTNNIKLKDDLNIGPLMRWPSAVKENTLVWYQSPKELITFVEEKQASMSEAEWMNFTKENEKLNSFYSTLSEDDNPYLIFTKIEL